MRPIVCSELYVGMITETEGRNDYVSSACSGGGQWAPSGSYLPDRRSFIVHRKNRDDEPRPGREDNVADDCASLTTSSGGKSVKGANAGEDSYGAVVGNEVDQYPSDKRACGTIAD